MKNFILYFKAFILFLVCNVSICTFSQTLYVPYGTNGIGTSTNGNIGIGVSSPGANLSFGNVNDGRNTPDGITWYSPAPLDYGIYRTSGPFQAPNYQQLKMAWSTGIIIDGGSIYGKSGIILQPSGGNVGLGTTTPAYKLDVAGDINFTGNLLKNGQPLAGGSSAWTQSGSEISSTGNVQVSTNYWLHLGDKNNTTSGFLGILASSSYNTYADIARGSLYFRKANWDGNNGAILGIQSNKTVTINYWETYDNTVIDTKGHALAVNGGIWSHYLTVDGKIIAQDVEVNPNVWPDYVFTKDYKLMPLPELEKYITANQHLPSVPTETEVKEKGINLGDMNATLLRKIEELTKYVIEQNKVIEDLKVKVEVLQNK